MLATATRELEQARASEIRRMVSISNISQTAERIKITIGNGKRGPVAKQLQDRFFGMFDGTHEESYVEEGAGPDGPVYPGTCRDRGHPAGPGTAIRLNMGRSARR